jgi:ankyrin repeat protein
LYDGRSVLRQLNARVPVDYVTPERETPPFVAVRQGTRKFVGAVLDRGANVNARGRDGCTPLWVATQFARNEIAELLLDRGASVDAANDVGRTALMSAGMRGNQPLVELLLKRGANLQLTVGNDKTAVSYAREEAIARLQRCFKSERGTTPRATSRSLVAKRSGLGTTFDFFCVNLAPTGSWA